MELKLFNVMNSKDVLEKLSKESFTSKISYIIQRNVKKINEEFVNINTEREKLFKKYGKETDYAGYQITLENKDIFLKEMNDLLVQDVDIDILQIPLSEFDYRLTPEEMGLIDWMFKFDIE